MKRAAVLYIDSNVSSVWMLRIKDGDQTLTVETYIPYCDAIKAGDIDELCTLYNCELVLERNSADLIDASACVLLPRMSPMPTTVVSIAPDTVAMVREFHEAFGYEIPEEPCVLGVHTPYAKEFLRYAESGLKVIEMAAKVFLSACPNPHMLPLCIQRVALHAEEFGELCAAMADEDMVKCLDACEDMQYIDAGTLVSLGLAPVHHEAFRRVHASNMSKLKDGKVIKDSNGKVVKGDWYSPVDLSDLVV